MVAAVLNGEKSARAFLGHAGAIWLRLRDDARHAVHRREALRVDARGAASDDNARVRTLPMQSPDGLARLPGRLAGDGASVDDDRAGAGMRARQFLAVHKVQSAAESENFRFSRMFSGRAHAGVLSKRLDVSRVSNSNSTGPVINT